MITLEFLFLAMSNICSIRDKVMVNPVYMTPGLLASGSYPPLQTDNEALVNN